ncbi:MAG: bifunctional homocysteine S-methyltransferase/methylenetetrahydrofolate reductase [Spirochaetales bacterium]|nr:bifunctional homocysteine S-methyltransferase/methylenetetrahydrofolate reductase [Spirochaetales bacterium]
MRKAYLERLKEGALIFDGAMGTLLYTKGITLNRCFEELNLSQPELIKEIHQEYIEAGAEVLETNSYGANSLKLAAFGLETSLVEINSRAVELAREAAGDDNYVAAAVGPLGVYVKPFGRIDMEQAAAYYKEQLTALIEAKPDLILFETFRNLDELLLAAKVSKKLAPSMPVQAQFTLGEGLSTEMAHAIKWAQALDQAAEVDVLGVNCSLGPADILEVLQSIRDKVEKPIAILPNAGYPKEVDGRLIYLSSPEYFAAYSRRFIDSGATIVGGCCGSTPEHIREIAKGISSRTVMRGSKIISVKEEVQEKQEIPLTERSRLGYLVAKNRWINLVELLPPQGTDFTKIVEKSAALYRAGVHGINLPDGPRASARISGIMTAVQIESQAKIETVFHYCCRDRNLIGMQSDLLGAYAMGIRNILIVTGDPPKLGGYPNATGVFDVDSIGLTTLVSRLNRGVDFGGNDLGKTTSFVIGVGANPASLSLNYEIERTYKKVEAGAQFIITQPVFDTAVLDRFLEKVKDINVPILAGAWPLASYKNALFLQNEVPEVDIPEPIMERMKATKTKEEAIEEGIAITTEIIAQVQTKIRGVQISPPFGRIETALNLIDRITESRKKI